uniref:Ovule protein n=1 Tax=Strongyloides papillosus TaxID=174720 RepID=A0A0N5C279_STREA
MPLTIKQWEFKSVNKRQDELLCIRVKDERKMCSVATFEAINGRTNHWRHGREKVNSSTENINNYHNYSDFPMPDQRTDSLPSENSSQAKSQSDL